MAHGTDILGCSGSDRRSAADSVPGIPWKESSHLVIGLSTVSSGNFWCYFTVTCEQRCYQLRQVSPRSSKEIVLCWEGLPLERSSPVVLIRISQGLLPLHKLVSKTYQDLQVQPPEPAVHHEAHIIVSMCVKPARVGSSLFQFGRFRVVLSNSRLIRGKTPPCGGAPC